MIFWTRLKILFIIEDLFKIFLTISCSNTEKEKEFDVIIIKDLRPKPFPCTIYILAAIFAPQVPCFNFTHLKNRKYLSSQGL